MNVLVKDIYKGHPWPQGLTPYAISSALKYPLPEPLATKHRDSFRPKKKKKG